PRNPASPHGPAAAARQLFLFPAAAGIRAFHVTGVQTCALPISLATMRTLPPALTVEPAAVSLRVSVRLSLLLEPAVMEMFSPPSAAGSAPTALAALLADRPVVTAASACRRRSSVRLDACFI